jgi:hypothetical protein
VFAFLQTATLPLPEPTHTLPIFTPSATDFASETYVSCPGVQIAGKSVKSIELSPSGARTAIPEVLVTTGSAAPDVPTPAAEGKNDTPLSFFSSIIVLVRHCNDPNTSHGPVLGGALKQ